MIRNLIIKCKICKLLRYVLLKMDKLRNIIVTGSNKGIGYGIVENLAQKQGWNIIMACRNVVEAEKSKQ